MKGECGLNCQFISLAVGFDRVGRISVGGLGQALLQKLGHSKAQFCDPMFGSRQNCIHTRRS